MKRLLVLIVTLVALPTFAQPSGGSDYVSNLRLARIYEETRDLQNAIRLYGELFAAHPDVPEISEGYFRVLYASKRFADAEMVLRKRIELDGENFEHQLSLAKTIAKQNKHDEAVDAFARAEIVGADMPPYSRTVGIVGAMLEVSYAEEALEYLKRARKESDQPDLLTGELGSLYYKLGRYEEGTKEYVSILKSSDAMLNYIQQRIAYFGADTSVRTQMLRAIVSAVEPERAKIPQLRLLAWSFGELKEYRRAFGIMQLLDERAGQEVSGYELLQFAERARSEGALDVAVDAYKDAVVRMKRSVGNDQRRQYFISQAELGALKTEAGYLISRNASKEEYSALAGKFRNFADTHRENDLVLEALVRGGELAYKQAFDLELARSLYAACISRSGGYNDRAREAYFAIEEIGLIRGDFVAAFQTLSALSGHLDKRNRAEDTDVRKRILFEQARLAYYKGDLDTALSQLTSIAEDAESEQSNDAIALKGFIEDNRDAGDVSIKLYIKADHAALAREYPTAISALKTIRESAPNAPITDDAILRESELLVKAGKAQEAVKILEAMQQKMSLSPLADRAGFRIAEITEVELKQPQIAQKLYEEFLERHAKSSFVAEARKRARRLRGDAF